MDLSPARRRWRVGLWLGLGALVGAVFLAIVIGRGLRPEQGGPAVSDPSEPIGRWDLETDSLDPPQAPLSLVNSAGASPGTVSGVRKRISNRTLCGPLSLLVVLDRAGIELGKPERLAILQTGIPHGTSMGQLKALAERQGLHAVGVELTVASLKRLRLHAIVLLEGVEFAAVTGYTSYGVQVVRPATAPRVVPDARFEQMFGKPGKALLLSPQPLVPEELGLGPATPPALRPSRTLLVVGRTFRPTWQGSLTLHNDGKGTIHVRRVTTSCTCVKAAVAPEEIPAGGSATLSAEGTQRDPGAFRHDILLETDAPDVPIVRIPVRGLYGAPVSFEAPVLTVHDVLEGEPAAAEMPLVLAKDVDPSLIQFVAPEGAPLDVQAAHNDRGDLVARLHWQGAPKAGWYRHQVQVRAKGLSGGPLPSLDVAVHVVPRWEAVPRSVLIRDEDLVSPWWRVVSIRPHRVATSLPSQGRGECRVSWSRPEFDEAIQVAASRGDGRETVLKLSPKAVGKLEPLSGQRATLVIQWPGAEGSCDVVVYLGRSSLWVTDSDPPRLPGAQPSGPGGSGQ